ncbi:DMT family transporter [Halorussus gelatinilyticus]|uniref:DMT family transporter n=1 Tax=Halorussus gelatinilyticus TaxID=2937524 RepID=A0A8U0IH46_9EURY|nr:DMT family transporter [Halorussus gelatinilyticus]UPW00001.1 DMT family transporter [Halorussus gelatinilyticus]
MLATVWGGSFVAIEIGLHYFPPLVFAGLRYAVAGSVVLGYAAVATDRWRPRERDEYLAVGVVGAFVIAGYHGLLYLGELRVSGAVASVVVSLSPVLTAGFAAVLLDERLTVPKGVGFALGIVGVGVVAGLNPTSALSASVLGVGLVLLGIACFALGGVLTRPLRTDFPIATMEGWAMLGGSGLLFVAGRIRGESLAAIRLTPTALASFAYLTLFSGVVAYLLYFHLLDELGPTRLNLVGYLEPVVATLASWAVLDELVGPSTLVGFAAIFAGFAVLNRHVVREVAVSVRGSSARGDESVSEDAATGDGTAWSSSAGPADD